MRTPSLPPLPHVLRWCLYQCLYSKPVLCDRTSFLPLMALQVVCSSCECSSSSYESFVDLQLELRRAPSVEAALTQFTRSERLVGDNRYHCPRCKELVEASKRLQLHSTPHVLVLQLKRFGFGR